MQFLHLHHHYRCRKALSSCQAGQSLYASDQLGLIPATGGPDIPASPHKAASPKGLAAYFALIVHHSRQHRAGGGPETTGKPSIKPGASSMPRSLPLPSAAPRAGSTEDVPLRWG